MEETFTHTLETITQERVISQRNVLGNDDDT